MPLLNPKNLHHSYGIVGGDVAVSELLKFLEKDLQFSVVGNPDFFHETFETLGIDDSRRIKEIHSSKSFVAGKKRIFVIVCKGMTHEAQNSLLKIFEEPHEDTHFFLVMPSLHTLLPTLLSRLSVIQGEKSKEISEEAVKFLKLSKKDKVAFVDDLAKDISDEKMQKSDAFAFLGALESALYQKTDMKKITDSQKKAFVSIGKAREYMNDRSPSAKQLLEFVALSL